MSLVKFKVKELQVSDLKEFCSSLYLEAMTIVGQKKPDDEVRIDYFVNHLSEHIKKYYSPLTKFEIREALKYGSRQDEVGGSVYIQRVEFWLKKYFNEVWLPKNKKDIHNQSNLEKKMIAPKEITPQEFIISQFELYRTGKIGFLGTKVFEALDQLGLKNKIWNAEKSWEFIFKACESLKTKASSGNAFADYRNINDQCKKIVKGKIETVSLQILSETKRKMVKDLFKKFDSKDDVEMWLDMMLDEN